MLRDSLPKPAPLMLKVKGRYDWRRHGHGKEGTDTEPLRLWTSNIDELFLIELRLSTAIVWHI